MKTIISRIALLLLGSLFAVPTRSSASELIFSQSPDGQSVYGPALRSTDGTANNEIADDFLFIGQLDRVVAEGFILGNTPGLQGVYVRFYQFGIDRKPGALQAEYYIPAGDSNLVAYPQGELDIRLTPGFVAQGQHFISVQPIIDYWYWWSANSASPQGESFYFRDRVAQSPWQRGDNQPYSITNADVSFYLYGQVAGPGNLERLGTNGLARSGYLEIFGANFGGSGQVLVDGLSAPVADWTSTHVVAYVPETTRLATVPVQVVTAGGASNTKLLAVTARQPGERVNWRFRMNGPYAQVRPAIGPDNTVYAIDVFDHLYALSPDGGLKWLVRGAGNKGVAVGMDSSIYVASEDAIKAFDRNGSLKWTFVQTPRAFICLGVSVGPDGNIYSVGTEGPGVFSLTPNGNLRWQQHEFYDRRIVDYGEIVFGANGGNSQMYFYANNHMRALRLDGSPVFTIPGTVGQPAIGPDGKVHTALAAYSPNGTLAWSFQSPYPYNTFTAPDVGSDGVHYVVQNLGQLFACNAGGSQRWHVTLTNYVADPIVDPFNAQLVMGSADTLDHPGFITSRSAVDGRPLWHVPLPPEDTDVFNPVTGQYGFNQFVDTRARFTPDGSTVYVVTATATGDNSTSKSFVYSINATGTNPPRLKKVRVSNLSLAGRMQGTDATVTAIVKVIGENGAPVPGATTDITWFKPGGSSIQGRAVTQSDGTASFSTTGQAGTYMLRVDAVSKTGCTLDVVRSVGLLKGITVTGPQMPIGALPSAQTDNR